MTYIILSEVLNEVSARTAVGHHEPDWQIQYGLRGAMRRVTRASVTKFYLGNLPDQSKLASIIRARASQAANGHQTVEFKMVSLPARGSVSNSVSRVTIGGSRLRDCVPAASEALSFSADQSRTIEVTRTIFEGSVRDYLPHA